MTSPARAAVEIVGDASEFGPRLERDIQRAIDTVDIDTRTMSMKISSGVAEGVQEAIEHFEDLEVTSAQTFTSMEQDAESFARALTLSAQQLAEAIGVNVQTAQRWIDGLSVPIEKNRRALVALGATLADTVEDGFEGVGRTAIGAGKDVNDGFLRPLQRGFGNLGNLITSAAAGLVGLASNINPAGLITVAATIAAIAAALPLIIGLAGALVNLLGLLTVLPAALGALAGGLIVATVAFNGFGDAMSAILEGDPEKIAEALEKLAPAARQVAQEFERILPTLRSVGRSIQQEFFEPLVGQVTIFGNTTLPAIRGELDTLAQSLGRLAGNLGDTVNEAQNVSILERTFATTARIVDELSGPVSRLGDALFKALDASLPLMEQVGAEVGDLIDGFAQWLGESIDDGSFQTFFEKAIDTLGRLWELGGAIGELLGTLFSGTEEGGRDFISTLTDLTQRMTEFFKSAEGQEALQDFEEIIGAVGVILGYVVNVVREVIDIFTELDDAVEGVINFFTDLWDLIVVAWNAIVAGTDAGVSAVGDFFSDLWEKAQTIWRAIVDGVSSAVDSVITFFTELPGKIWEAIQALPGLVAAALNAMIDQAINILAVGTAAVIVFFTDMPGQLMGAWNAFTAWISGVWDSVVQTISEGVDAAVAFVQSIPERLAAIGTAIAEWATNTWNSVVQTTTDAWNGVLEFFSTLPGKIGAWFQQAYNSVVAKGTELVNWVKGIPGRILSALGNVGSMLYDAGAKIIQGLINGISSKIQQLREKIASAVQQIRDHLPFSPAKTGPLSGSGSPQIAGAVIAEMIAAGLDAGTPLITQAADRAAAAASPFGAIGQAGGAPLTAGGGPAAGQPVMSPVAATATESPVFLLEIDGQTIEATVTKVVDRKVEVEVRRLLAGTRGL